MTRSVGGSPARSRARRRASFPTLYFFLDFFLANLILGSEDPGYSMPMVGTRAMRRAAVRAAESRT